MVSTECCLDHGKCLKYVLSLHLEVTNIIVTNPLFRAGIQSKTLRLVYMVNPTEQMRKIVLYNLAEQVFTYTLLLNVQPGTSVAFTMYFHNLLF